MAKRDIVGQQFGLLVILREFKNEKGYSICKCKCQCGNVKNIYKSNILAGRTQSCGCLEEKNRKKFRDLCGKRFGKLTAVAPSSKRKDGNVVWVCHCDCGNESLVSGRNLVRGFTKSCGCSLIERSNIAGKRFGRLTALHPDTDTGTNPRKWVCLCDCGNKCSVRISNLKNLHTQSCGCMKEEEKRTIIDGTCLEIIVSTKINKNNQSGIKGVSYYSRTNSWVATLTFRGRHYYLGKYTSILDAAKARWRAEDEIVKPFVEEHLRLLKRRTDS